MHNRQEGFCVTEENRNSFYQRLNSVASADSKSNTLSSLYVSLYGRSARHIFYQSKTVKEKTHTNIHITRKIRNDHQMMRHDKQTNAQCSTPLTRHQLHYSSRLFIYWSPISGRTCLTPIGRQMERNMNHSCSSFPQWQSVHTTFTNKVKEYTQRILIELLQSNLS
jgi:hypothetical protein